MNDDGPDGLKELLRFSAGTAGSKRKQCRIDYAITGLDGKTFCRKCGRLVVSADTVSGWRHVRSR